MSAVPRSVEEYGQPDRGAWRSAGRRRCRHEITGGDGQHDERHNPRLGQREEVSGSGARVPARVSARGPGEAARAAGERWRGQRYSMITAETRITISGNGATARIRSRFGSNRMCMKYRATSK